MKICVLKNFRLYNFDIIFITIYFFIIYISSYDSHFIRLMNLPHKAIPFIISITKIILPIILTSLTTQNNFSLKRDKQTKNFR